MLLMRNSSAKMVNHEAIIFKNGDPNISSVSAEFATNSNETGQVALTVPADVNVINGISIFPNESFGAGGLWRAILRSKTGAATAGAVLAVGAEYVHDVANNEIFLRFDPPIYVVPGREYWFGWHNSSQAPDLKTCGIGNTYRELDTYSDGPAAGARTLTQSTSSQVAMRVHCTRRTTIQKKLTANVAITNTSATTGFVRFGLTKPVQKDALQELVQINGASGWSTLQNGNGIDEYLFIRPSIAAGGTFNATIEFILNVSSFNRLSIQDTPPDVLTSAQQTTFLGPQNLMESDDADIIARANIIKAISTDPWVRALEAYKFPRDNYPIRDMTVNQGAAYAIKKDSNGDYIGGDCTEFSGTTAALCKAMGIPATMVNVWNGGSDGEASGGFPNHMRMKAFLPDPDGSGSHWYYLDPNLGTNEQQYHYGFAHGVPTGIHSSLTGSFAWSSTSDTSGATFSNSVSYAMTNV